MTTLRQAAQQALEALKLSTPNPRPADDDYAEQGWKEHDAAIAALKAALAEPVQEPVAWMYPDDYAGILKNQSRAEVFQKAWCNPAVCVPFYTAPPQRKPLTDEEIKAKAMEAFNSYWDGDDETLVNKYGHGVYLSRFIEFARAIEAAHGIKEKE